MASWTNPSEHYDVSDSRIVLLFLSDVAQQPMLCPMNHGSLAMSAELSDGLGSSQDNTQEPDSSFA